MDEAVRGTTKEGEKTETATVEKRQRQSECKREIFFFKMEKMMEKYAMLFHRGGSAPMVPLSVQHTYDQKMKNRYWHVSIIEYLVVQLQYVCLSAVSHGLFKPHTFRSALENL